MRERLATMLPRLKAAAGRRTGSDGETRAGLDQALLAAQADYEGAGPALSSIPDDATGPRPDDQPADPVEALADVFGLGEVEQDLFVLAAAAELDANFALVYGHLRGLRGSARASIGLALELAGIGTLEPAGFEYLGVTGALPRHNLVTTGDGPWLGREVWVPERVLGYLLGARTGEPQVRALVVHPVPLAFDQATSLARALESGSTLAWVRARPGSAGLSLAASAFTAAGARCLCVDLDRAPVDADLPSLIGTLTREAGLLGAGLVLGGADRLLGPERNANLARLVAAAVPVVAVGARAWERGWLVQFPFTVEAPALTAADRVAAWGATGAAPDGGPGLAGLRLTPEAIAQTAVYARRLADVSGEAVSPDLVRRAARTVGGSSAPVRNTGAATSFADLVLPEHVDIALRRLVGWARHRDDALGRGTLLDLGRKGAGLAALFTGSPGTGKTLAAHVIADELGIDLVQVDLSSIVDKYIGETEKNLERVFEQAESLNVVLFFDEADALFGRRTEVKDSHDRHANQEVAYLLQRMENFEGLTILATNLRGNLDPAFSRRMNFIVHFPDPDVDTRRRLWRAHIDRLGPLDPADAPNLDQLAEVVEMAGGDIRNIVLAAGYDAAAAGTLPGHRHLREATIEEYRKLGRRVPAAGTLDA